MSLILDALNRSREDDNSVPGLATYHAVEQVSVDRRQYLLWVALSVAVVVIAWLFLERYSAPQLPARETEVRVSEISVSIDGGVDVAPEQPVVVEQAVTSIATSAPAAAEIISPAAVVQEPASVGSSSGVEVLPSPVEDLATDSEQRIASTVVARSEPLSKSAPPANDAVAELYENPPVAEKPVVRNSQRDSIARSAAGGESAAKSLNVDKIMQLAREEVKNAGLIDNSVPLLIDLSQQIKDSIPTVYYLRHDYSSDASRSTVVLNSKTLSVGGIPAAGMKVEEILPDAVILNYQGTQFRLRALNSWINL